MTAKSKELAQSRVLMSSVVSAGLSVLAASLSAPADCSPLTLKLICAAAAMASTAAAIFRGQDVGKTAGVAEATREVKAMP